MIITRTPFRMSFFGGGSDLPSFYEENAGSVLSTSINKYMYINLHEKFDSGVRIAYSKTEDVLKVAEISHPIVRNCLEYFDIDGGLEISSIADIPGRGTGLGSSSSYAVGLIKALSAIKNIYLSKHEIAEIACHIEINMCGDPIGKQDQYAASYGGFNVYKFSTSGVDVTPLNLPQSLLHHFSASLVSVYTGNARSAAILLKEQATELKKSNKIQLQKEMVSMVDEGVKCLRSEDLLSFGKLLNESWRLKKQLTNKITNQQIDEIYDVGMQAGAWGGKLLGAGMGGFVTFITSPSNVNNLKNAFKNYQLVELLPESSGAKILYNSEGDV